MSEREAFVQRAMEPGANRRALCREFGISPQTGYRWIRRARAGEGLEDRSRRPHHSPRRTPPEVETAILRLRAEHPTWGGRKLARWLQVRGEVDELWPSTVTEVLRRHGQLGPRAGQPRAFLRFEHPHPNDLWQMDFKGHVPCGLGRCHPLTVLDDHSRYNVGVGACADEQDETVRAQLIPRFREYGMPRRIGVDNGPPWGDGGGSRYTRFTVWLLRLGVWVTHSRPYHPQTLGKDERFHRTLKAEVLREPLEDLASAQLRFDRWRQVYNHERPHEGIGLEVPASRYRRSERAYPEVLSELEYPPGDVVRMVQDGGLVHLDGRIVRLSNAFRGERVAFRPTDQDGRYTVVFATVPIAEVDLTEVPRHTQTGVTYVSEHLSPMSPV